MKIEDKELFLDCLESAGVDNWEGYGVAIDEYNKIMKATKIQDDFSNLIHDEVLMDCTGSIEIEGCPPSIEWQGDIEDLYKKVRAFVIEVEGL